MSKYNKIMDNVRITPEMHERIMDNIKETDFEIQKPKAFFLKKNRIYMSIAACLIIFISSIIYFDNIINIDRNPIQITPNIVEYGSKSELSVAIGFEVKDINNIPFDVEKTQYTSYWDNIAEIAYLGKDNSITFRMAEGNEDISGDYNDYKEIKTYVVDSNSIILKGNDGLYSLAIWKDDTFSYAVKLDIDISETDLYSIIESIK